MQDLSIGDAENVPPNARAQQILGRFTNDTNVLFRRLAECLALEEGKLKAGAWDWQSWEEKFYQLFMYRRFVPHPVLLATSELPEFPRTWFFAPRDDRSSLIHALQEFQKERAFAGLRFHVGNLGGGDLLSIFQNFATTLDTYFTKMPKPYPPLEVIVPAHEAALPAFLNLDFSDKRQCRRAVGVELSLGLAQNTFVYEPVLREVHARLREGKAIAAVYFHKFAHTSPNNEQSGDTPVLERPLAGAINLSEFVDSSVGKFLWDELRSSLGAIVRIVANWQQVVLASENSSSESSASRRETMRAFPWIGLTGWAEALAKLELEYADPRSEKLAARFMQKLQDELESIQTRLETQKSLPKGTLRFSLRPTHSHFISQLAGVRAGVLPETGMGQEDSLIAMQAAFHGGPHGIFTLPNPQKLEVERFLEVLGNAAKAGWLGVRFL